jgi:hypothetical protein
LDRLFPVVWLDTLRQDEGGDEDSPGYNGENQGGDDEPLLSPRGHIPTL